MTLDHISHSQLNMWQRCPRQWFYRYVEGLKQPPSGALILGSAYHSALEGNFKQKITSLEDLLVDDCLDLYSDAWESRISEEELVVWDTLSQGESKDQGVALVREYMESTSPSVQPIKVEETYMSEVAGVKFVCRVDLEEVHRAIIDHKTSSKRYNQGNVDRDTQASAEAYALGRPIVFYNHVALKLRRPEIQVVRTIRTQSDIDWWLDMASQIILQMLSGVAPPRPTDWHCSERFCGYFERCRGELTRSYL